MLLDSFAEKLPANQPHGGVFANIGQGLKPQLPCSNLADSEFPADLVKRVISKSKPDDCLRAEMAEETLGTRTTLQRQLPRMIEPMRLLIAIQLEHVLI